jgi:large subunit ribosomal protein L15
MPPRMSLLNVQPRLRPSSTSLPSFLLPFLHQQTRPATILSSLSDTKGAYNKRIRRGRGPSSGKGKTSGRGHKGQKQHGKVPAGFTGGQTKELVVHGKSGFKNLYKKSSPCRTQPTKLITYFSRHAEDMSPVNLDKIQDWINQKRIDPTQPITVKELARTRAVHGVKDGIKLLARGADKLTSPINIVVSRASSGAIAAIEALGGSVTTRYYTKYAIHRIRQGKTAPFVSLKWDPEALKNPALNKVGMGSDPFERVKGMGFQYRLPDPTSRKDIEYYRDPAKRGYLAHTIGEGETPSLFHKLPRTDTDLKKAPSKKKREATENRLW